MGSTTAVIGALIALASSECQGQLVGSVMIVKPTRYQNQISLVGNWSFPCPIAKDCPDDLRTRRDGACRMDDGSQNHASTSLFRTFMKSMQTPQRDIAVGTYVSNRKRPELQNMFGDFSNLVTLRFRCDLNETFRSWLNTTHRVFTAAAAHSEVPYEELRRAFAQEGRICRKFARSS
jgi:hypothetical protein